MNAPRSNQREPMTRAEHTEVGMHLPAGKTSGGDANAPVMYRDMTEAQMLDWGRAESAARIADLSVRSAEGLKAAQANAEIRRKAIDATRGQAADMVLRATREARRRAG